ncbi:hypothetical protein CO683_02970 [Bradyrhizobium ottawaense]|uniref:Uncharacterized protein n=1 Tax=Bradyrhizobium ottawaense TaxID=931866 RepID=A0A2U8PF52_9BRAD|nr:hypothetical protein CIT37_32960 [Bradyrhizobium ottawaense]PDT72114.1 hypothetical protein CO683_02970 [Bradyrhizobium ottawaense]
MQTLCAAFLISCPGRSAAPLRRCAAEPGPISPEQPVWLGSRLGAATLARRSASGTRERNTGCPHVTPRRN